MASQKETVKPISGGRAENTESSQQSIVIVVREEFIERKLPCVKVLKVAFNFRILIPEMLHFTFANNTIIIQAIYHTPSFLPQLGGSVWGRDVKCGVKEGMVLLGCLNAWFIIF